MVQKFVKFIEKSPQRKVFLQILSDIANNNIKKYDFKKINGEKDLFRIRRGTVRILLRKTQTGYKIIDINNRGDVYKNL